MKNNQIFHGDLGVPQKVTFKYLGSELSVSGQLQQQKKLQKITCKICSFLSNC